MTILVLDLRIPATVTSANLAHALVHDILYRLFIYCGSFVILGTLWIAMNFQAGLLARLNRLYLWSNVLYLMVICVVPFSANLVASFPNNEASIIFYVMNLLCASSCQYLIFKTAFAFNLNQDLYTPAIKRAVIQRIALAPVCYAVALGISVWSTHAAFAMLLLPTMMYIFPGKIDKYEYEK